MFPEKKKMKNTGKLISTCIRDDQGYFVKAVFSEALSVENLATFFSNKRLCLFICCEHGELESVRKNRCYVISL